MKYNRLGVRYASSYIIKTCAIELGLNGERAQAQLVSVVFIQYLSYNNRLAKTKTFSIIFITSTTLFSANLKSFQRRRQLVRIHLEICSNGYQNDEYDDP